VRRIDKGQNEEKSEAAFTGNFGLDAKFGQDSSTGQRLKKK
jgi:hypothetical protein